VIDGCTFEMLDTSGNGPCRSVLTSDIDGADGTVFGSGFIFTGNWVGDIGMTSTTLNGAIDNVQTSLTINTGGKFPPTGINGFLIVCESEQMRVTAGAGSLTWTVTRGVNGTVAAAHASGVNVTMSLEAAILQQTNDTWSGVQISGNYSSTGGAPFVRGMGKGNGWTITGNQLGSTNAGGWTGAPIDLGDGTQLAQRKSGVMIAGNDMSGCAIAAGQPVIANAAAGHLRISIWGNSAPGGNTSDRLVFTGQMNLSGNNAQAPASGTLFTGAGTGATVVIQGNDQCGFIQVATGTGTAAGALIDVTFGTPYTTTGIPHSLPKVIIFPVNAAAYSAGIYGRDGATTTSKFRVECVNVPAASSVLQFGYFVFM
jgi:hypothetical protein